MPSYSLWVVNGFDYDENPFHYNERLQPLPYTNTSPDGERFGFLGGKAWVLNKPFRMFTPKDDYGNAYKKYLNILSFFIDGLVASYRVLGVDFYPIFTLNIVWSSGETEQIQLGWMQYYAHSYPYNLAVIKPTQPREVLWVPPMSDYLQKWVQVIVGYIPEAFSGFEVEIALLISGYEWVGSKKFIFSPKGSVADVYFDFGADIQVSEYIRSAAPRLPYTWVSGWSIDHFICVTDISSERNTIPQAFGSDFYGRIVLESYPSSYVYSDDYYWSDELRGELKDRNEYNYNRTAVQRGSAGRDGGGFVCSVAHRDSLYGYIGKAFLRVRQYPKVVLEFGYTPPLPTNYQTEKIYPLTSERFPIRG